MPDSDFSGSFNSVFNTLLFWQFIFFQNLLTGRCKRNSRLTCGEDALLQTFPAVTLLIKKRDGLFERFLPNNREILRSECKALPSPE